MNGASKLLDAVKQDCPMRAIRPVEYLRDAAERGAEEIAAAAALACSESGHCPDSMVCSATAGAVLHRLWRDPPAVAQCRGGDGRPAPPHPEGRGDPPRHPCPRVGTR